jgi:cytochrome P450
VPAGVPTIDADLYADEVIRDSEPLFRRIRDAGPLVWLPRHKLFAMGRFDDVRAALRDDATFVSGRGVAANPIANRLGRHTTLSSDGDVHDRRRKILMRSLGAKALAEIQETIDVEAQRLIDALVRRERFDAVRDFGSGLPVAVVAQLVGVRPGHTRMLEWAAATFDGLGPMNGRALRQTATALSLQVYTRRLARDRVAPGSWAASVFDARDRGEVSTTEARALIVDLVAPALDTTILGSAHLLLMLARNPEAWEEIRANPSLIPAAVVEAVRLASPVRVFTRYVNRDADVAGTRLRRGTRLAALYASANRDERRFPNPGRFDMHRDNNNHLGWGNGVHTCVGIHLAKLEMQALLRAMVPRVGRIEAGQPEPLMNNTLQGIAGLPVGFAGAAS